MNSINNKEKKKSKNGKMGERGQATRTETMQNDRKNNIATPY